MTRKLNIKLGLLLIPFAFIFLFEPLYKLSDPLPDIIGYLLLYFGLICLADLNHRIADALKGFKAAIGVCVLRFAALILLEELFDDSEASIGLLLFTFVLSLLELLVLIPAYKNLFEGLLSLGLMHDGSFVYSKKRKSKLKIDKNRGEKTLYVRESSKNATEITLIITVAFCVIKCLAATLPEMTSLATNQDYEFIRILRVITFLAVIPLGIFWLIRMIMYFVSLKKDKPFIDNLTALHAQVMSENPQIFDARILSTGFYIIIAALVLSIDLYADHVNIIHNSVFYAIIIISSLVLCKYSKKWTFVAGVSSVGATVSYFAHLFNKTLYSDPNFYARAVKKDVDAYNGFYRMAFTSAFDALFMLLTVAVTLIFLFDVYKKCSRYSVTDSNTEKKYYVSAFLKFAIPTISLATISSVGYVYFIFTQPYEDIGAWYFSYTSIIDTALSIIFAVSSIALVSHVKKTVESRYRIDL